MASPTSAPPGHELQQPGGQPGLLEDAHHRHPAGDDGARVGLEQHGVAERERGRDGADAEDQRHVERGDDPDDAHRVRWASERRGSSLERIVPSGAEGSADAS